jgi:hypothetical protein
MEILELVEDFMSVFKGNEDFYVENNFSAETKKATGKAKGKLKGEVYFKKAPVTDLLFANHLKGVKGLGICPIDSESKSHFGVVDIDNYDVSYRPIIDLIYENELPLFPVRSKSGGLHIYLILKSSVQAKSVVDALEEIIKLLGLRQTYGDVHVEIFPKQKKLSADTQGSCITLPYKGAEDPLGYLYDSDMKKVPFDKAVKILKKGRASMASLEEALATLVYQDAPPCIQTMALTGCIGKDSGRNNYLYSAAVYFKKKYGDDFKAHLDKLNEGMQYPIKEVELNTVFRSVVDHEYNYKCDDVPCRLFCDKAECRKREFGKGREKGHFTGLDYGPMVRVMTEDPYYVWELRDDTAKPFKKITFKNELALMDQRQFASLCIRELDTVPFRVPDNEWVKTLRTALTGITELIIPKSTDTTEGAEIRAAFMKYLSQKQAAMNLPVQIKMGFVFFQGGKYYFTHRGFESFLDIEKVRIGSVNLRESLLLYGATEDVLKYATAKGKPVEVPCWSKVSDTELAELEDYYADVFESDMDIINGSEKTEKVEGEESDEPDQF